MSGRPTEPRRLGRGQLRPRRRSAGGMGAARCIDRLELRGDETVLDAGCGSGRVTRLLLERLPRGRVIGGGRLALDDRAGAASRCGDEVELIVADLLELELDEPVDAIFSNATFHWILDHRRLFGGSTRRSAPGGRLEAQCGGIGNVAEFLNSVEALNGDERFAPYLRGIVSTWNFASPGRHGGAAGGRRLRGAALLARGEAGAASRPARVPRAVVPRRVISSAFRRTCTRPTWMPSSADAAPAGARLRAAEHLGAAAFTAGAARQAAKPLRDRLRVAQGLVAALVPARSVLGRGVGPGGRRLSSRSRGGSATGSRRAFVAAPGRARSAASPLDARRLAAVSGFVAVMSTSGMIAS